ncbi:heat shock cognate 70 kDa protein-like protein [Tanacetum coccineum]
MFRSRLNSTRGDISVYLGESVMVKENVFLDKFALSGLKLGHDGHSDVEVCFGIDVNGILRDSAREISTGQDQF